MGLSWAILSPPGHLCHNIVTRRKCPEPPGPIFGSCFRAHFFSETCSISVLFLGPVLDAFGNPFQGPSKAQTWSRNSLKTTSKKEPLSGPLCKAASGRPEPPCTVKTNKKSTFFKSRSGRKTSPERPRNDPKMDLTQTEKGFQNQPESQDWPKTGPRHFRIGPGQPKAKTGQAKGPG